MDDLLGDDEPHATFHDAELLSLTVDDQARQLVATWRVCVGDPSAPDEAARERRRDGTLMLSGLTFWVTDPSADVNAGGSWLTSYGSLGEAPNVRGRELASRVPPGGVGWYLYFSDSNSFAYCGARAAAFEWA